ncbi:hypothetical protein ACFL0D_06760 [Thermoproteota archaeon]
MKYVIVHEAKEPHQENLAKALEIEKERGKRRKKGEKIPSMKMITPFYITLDTPWKSFWVVDCEPEDILHWSRDYGDFFNAKVYPVVTREEWEKI